MTGLTLVCLIVCLYIGGQGTAKPSSQGPEVRRVCVDSLDIRVGDSYSKVAKIISMKPDPNGMNDNSDWVAGKNTDFVSTDGPTYSLDDGSGMLRSIIYFIFDDRQRLRSLRLAWTFDGAHTAEAGDAVLSVLLGKIHKCLNNQTVKVIDGKRIARIDFGTYSQELVFDTQKWRITYKISEEP